MRRLRAVLLPARPRALLASLSRILRRTFRKARKGAPSPRSRRRRRGAGRCTAARRRREWSLRRLRAERRPERRGGGRERASGAQDPGQGHRGGHDRIPRPRVHVIFSGVLINDTLRHRPLTLIIRVRRAARLPRDVTTNSHTHHANTQQNECRAGKRRGPPVAWPAVGLAAVGLAAVGLAAVGLAAVDAAADAAARGLPAARGGLEPVRARNKPTSAPLGHPDRIRGRKLAHDHLDTCTLIKDRVALEYKAALPARGAAARHRASSSRKCWRRRSGRRAPLGEPMCCSPAGPSLQDAAGQGRRLAARPLVRSLARWPPAAGRRPLAAGRWPLAAGRYQLHRWWRRH